MRLGRRLNLLDEALAMRLQTQEQMSSDEEERTGQPHEFEVGWQPGGRAGARRPLVR